MAESSSGGRRKAAAPSPAAKRQARTRASASDLQYIQTGRRPEAAPARPGLLRRAYNYVRGAITGASA